MRDRKQPSALQTFMFFLGFIILFFLVFALGVIVGKGLITEDLLQIRKQEKKSDQLLASSSVNIINNKDELEPKNVPVKKEVKPEIVPEIKKIPVKKVVKKDAPTEKTVEKKSVKPEKKKEIKTEKTKESVKEDKYVTKFDYNKPDFPNTDQGGKYSSVVVDCLTLWLNNLLREKVRPRHVPSQVRKLLKAIRACPSQVVMVSNELGLGLVPGDAASREFRDVAGRINQLIAAEADQVYFLVSGLPLRLK